MFYFLPLLCQNYGLNALKCYLLQTLFLRVFGGLLVRQFYIPLCWGLLMATRTHGVAVHNLQLLKLQNLAGLTKNNSILNI